MIAVFNAITNIAEDIEKNVFDDCQSFLESGLTDIQMRESIHEYCSKVIQREFKKVKSVHGFIGKYKKEYTTINEGGKYKIGYVAIDNLDLLDVNFALGSIFGIYEGQMDAFHLKAAMYITYGPTFQLVFASKTEGVIYFSFENGEFIEQDPLTLEKQGKINSTAGLVPEWSDAHRALVDSFFNKGYRLRFSDSLSLDTHQILFKKGGIYSSPATKSFPEGKLETIFEAFPISYIIEQAGGRAISEKGRILDITSTDIKQKTPIYFGSETEIQAVEDSFNS
ncbi:FIG domain-containing protein [Halarcobacter anaerophilus]|uniref:Fructose-bisphosphatase class I n=1 Tax=Halarcobacter anaerophilus TaxID=877500 RepID=A0A4Q0XXF0_9BACT|nr:fructose-bisphosphatase class I [Halarcobacter anaerophilus]QDF30158.1 fructose-1,6-bisphosphatase I [Halarcobacter anaerophilus]RXJ62276.1 fructose-bisphosphatase class I [Halarcobacter anaerophilus]